MSMATHDRAADTGTLVIRLKKNRDGAASLSCTREDGTVTWQRQGGASAGFFPKHDLTHYAVESVLELRDGFFGLVAAGWDIGDFGTPWPRGPLPQGGVVAELIVGLLDLERASGERYRAEEYREKVSEYHAARGIRCEVQLDDAQLDRIRSLRAELCARLDATPPGESLELTFAVPGGHA